MRVRVSRRGLERLGAAGERARDSRKGDLCHMSHVCANLEQTVEQLKFSLNSVQHTAVLGDRVFTVQLNN